MIHTLCIVCLVLVFSPRLTEQITYPGGRFEPCIDPAIMPSCFPTQCIHLYTVPQQYYCQVTTYPKYDYDPTGQQCARPECICQVGYHGGACKPHLDNDCLPHKCTRNNASSFSPLRIHPKRNTSIEISGIGLTTFPAYDSARVVFNDSNCSSTTPNAPGFVEMLDLGYDNDVDVSLAQYFATPTSPGMYTVCYKERDWGVYHPLDPGPLIVAGAVKFFAEHDLDGTYARANDFVTVRFFGYGFMSGLDLVKFIPRNVTGYNFSAATACTDTAANATLLYYPMIINHTFSLAVDVVFLQVVNYSVCYQTYGGDWIYLGNLTVIDVPLWYTVQYSQPSAGGLILRSYLNLSFGGAVGGYDITNDQIQLRLAIPTYNNATNSLAWNVSGACGDSYNLYAIASSGVLVGNTTTPTTSSWAKLPVYFATPVNITSVCYYSAKYKRWVDVSPLYDWDVLAIRNLWADGFDAPQPTCLTGWTLAYGSAPSCTTDIPISENYTRQNVSITLPPASGLGYVIPTSSVIQPQRLTFWVKPSCANSPSARLTFKDSTGKQVVMIHFGCPFISVNHVASSVDWATNHSEPGYVGDSWHKVVVWFQWDQSLFQMTFDGVVVDNGLTSQPGHSFLTYGVNGIGSVTIDNDNPSCSVLFDEFQAYNCFDIPNLATVSSEGLIGAYGDLPSYLLRSDGALNSANGLVSMDVSSLFTSCLGGQ